jgi:acyl-CoA dehydrogenase
MISDERDILIRTADKIFDEIATVGRLADAQSGIWRSADWELIEEAGLPLALVSEEAGGFGFPVVDALAIVRRAGAFAVPFPLAETMVANRLLAQAGLKLPGGALSIATGSSRDRLDLSCEGGEWRLLGKMTRVPWGRFVGFVVAVVDNSVILVPRASMTVCEDSNLAGEARDSMEVDCVLPPESVAVGVAATCMPLRLAGAALRSIAIAGAVERVLEMTTLYANERVQFGRQVGKFQAIQQYLAIVAGHVAAASAAADIAADAIAGDVAALPIAIAKTRSGEAAGATAALAHQIHGAIGITQEHSLHFLTRRLWSWRDEFGSEAEWSPLIGREVAAAGADGLWPLIVAA